MEMEKEKKTRESEAGVFCNLRKEKEGQSK
jgi:hypothetical protein